MPIRFSALATDQARAYQAGGLDANGQKPEHHISQGGDNPCRHCLNMIAQGAAMLVLAHRPFPAPQPYAEIGPIFLCAAQCEAASNADLPAILTAPDYILRGYGADDRIIYGSGAVINTADLLAEAEARLADPNLRYLHLRSARNNCYQLRIDRA